MRFGPGGREGWNLLLNAEVEGLRVCREYITKLKAASLAKVAKGDRRWGDILCPGGSALDG